jgi:hypothetical protein
MTPGSSYCKRCGARLSAEDSRGNKLSQVPMESLVGAIVVVAVVGVGAPIGLMAVMKEVLHLENRQILIAALLSVLPFLAAEIVFIRLLLRTRSGGNIAQAKGATTRELEGALQRALPEPASGITEHTTYTLERKETECY